MAKDALGYVGLGTMGAAIVANMVAGGLGVRVYDSAGTLERAPEGAVPAGSIEDIARACDVVFVCVPDGAASLDVANAVAAADGRRVRALINMSTTGVEAADAIAAALDGSGVEFIDAPVSGGRAGAVAGTITVMWSGSQALLGELKPVLETCSKSQFFVGPRPGQGQALKLLNNFLSATAMSATSEAMIFGRAHGLDMTTMLDAVNVSTGRNTATSDKFPNRIVTGTYDAGFRMALMAKDVVLYLNEVRAAGTPDGLGSVVADYYRDGLAAFPDGDFTEIFKTIGDDEG